MFRQLTILGPGLLGASLMQAMKRRQLCERAVAWSRRPETRVKCAEQPWCDAVFERAEDAVVGADLVVVCTPVETIVPLIEKVGQRLEPGAIVTDVGSTKSLIVRHGHAATPQGRFFVGSHPMAGSEKAGLEFSDPELFERRACFVTPLLDTHGPSVERVVRLWRAVGMEVATVNPEAHDEIVANISHLPHVLASCLCSYLSTRDPAWRNFAGGGLRDTTRIASGDPTLWKSIIVENREEILRAIDGFQKELDGLRAAVCNNQPFEILNHLERGKAYRDRLRPA